MRRWLVLPAGLLLVGACGRDDASNSTSATTGAVTTTTAAVTTTTSAVTTTAATVTTTAASDMRSIDAVAAAITVDGDASDWEGIPGLDLTLSPIQGEEQIADQAASVKVAYDDEFLYGLFIVA